MEYRTLSLTFRHALANWTAIRHGDSIRMIVSKLLPLLERFDEASDKKVKRHKTFYNTYVANRDHLKYFNFDEKSIEAGAAIAVLSECFGIFVTLADVLADLGAVIRTEAI